jgi:hypothetical protein
MISLPGSVPAENRESEFMATHSLSAATWKLRKQNVRI